MKFGRDARNRLLRGVDILADAGDARAQGPTVWTRKGYGGPRISNDGVTVAKSIELEDLVAHTGAEVVREAAVKTGGRRTIFGRAARRSRRKLRKRPPDYDREKLQERLAKLSGGVAAIVGGATEIEVKERKDRVDDAMHATRAAVEEGIVPGGGVALICAAHAFDGLNSVNDDQKMGIKIVRRALCQPTRDSRKCWRSRSAHRREIARGRQPEHLGYDAQRSEYVDMAQGRDIVDPTGPCA